MSSESNKSDYELYLQDKTFSEESWESFSDQYTDFNLSDKVESAGEGELKLKPEAIKALSKSYEVFTDGVAEGKYWDEAKESLTTIIKDLIKEVTTSDLSELSIDPSEVKFKVSVDEDSDSVEIEYVGESLELPSMYYLGQEDWASVVGGSFSSFDWLAILADEDSPLYDGTFYDAYVATEKAQTASELISTNDHTALEWEKKLIQFLKDNYTPNFEDWKKQVDKYAEDKLGMTPDDISGDYRWRSLYDDGYDVDEAYESWKEDLPRNLLDKVIGIEEENEEK
jgi:hypothetical protein